MIYKKKDKANGDDDKMISWLVGVLWNNSKDTHNYKDAPVWFFVVNLYFFFHRTRETKMNEEVIQVSLFQEK